MISAKRAPPPCLRTVIFSGWRRGGRNRLRRCPGGCSFAPAGSSAFRDARAPFLGRPTVSERAFENDHLPSRMTVRNAPAGSICKPEAIHPTSEAGAPWSTMQDRHRLQPVLHHRSIGSGCTATTDAGMKPEPFVELNRSVGRSLDKDPESDLDDTCRLLQPGNHRSRRVCRRHALARC